MPTSHILVLSVIFVLSACATQPQHLNFYALGDRSLPATSSASYLETFNPNLLTNNHLAIGYVTAEQVLRECPTGVRCTYFPAEKPLVSLLEQKASAQGGHLITHAEKRYLKWVRKGSRCTQWETVTVGYNKNSEPRTQRRCTQNQPFTSDVDTVVLHGLVWRKDSSFYSTESQRSQQIAAWQGIIKQYGNNCLVVSPSAQKEYESLKFLGSVRDVILVVNREMMKSVTGLSLAVDQTPLGEIFLEINKPIPEIPCKIQHKPFTTGVGS